MSDIIITVLSFISVSLLTYAIMLFTCYLYDISKEDK